MGIPIRITKIRSKSEYPGLTDSEVKYLELISILTNGTQVEINETGTVLKFSPGIIINNASNAPIQFDCGNERGIGFFLEGILPLIIFGKNKLDLILTGISSTVDDIGVDVIQLVQIPLLKKFGLQDVDFKASSRGENCEVSIKATPIRKLNSVRLTDPGKIKKVRGVAFTSKMNVQMGNRAAYAAKGRLHSFLPDIWIHTEHCKTGSAMLGLALVSESNTGSFISSEYLRGESSYFETLETEVPEDLGTLAVIGLLEEIMYGGFVDSNNQALVLLLMSLSSQSFVRLGRVSSQAVEVLRLIDQVIRVKFNFEEIENPKYQQNTEDDEEQELPFQLPKNFIVSCVGINYENMARIAF